MACFLAPAAEAVVTTIATKVIESKESKTETEAKAEASVKIPFSRKLKWLNNLLWGGSALRAFEHIWHGEVVPWFPFLTAAGDPADTAEMLHEIATVGVSMAAVVTVIWGCMVAAVSVMEKRASNAQLSRNE